jgi:thiamine biosynthesis lipoprotein
VKRALLGLVAALSAACNASGPRPMEPLEDPLLFERPLFGVAFQLTLVEGDAEQRTRLAEEILDELTRLETVLSNWDPSSAISRVNADRRAGAVRVDRELADAIELGLAFCRFSGGAFDPTVGAVLDEMGFYAQEARELSAGDALRLRAHVGCDLVRLEEGRRGERMLLRSVDGMKLDLSGLSKGVAVARAVEMLRARGVLNAFVAAGASTVYGLGPGPTGLGWELDVPGKDGTRVTWHLENEAVSTSGRLSQPFDADGRRLSHVIDPRTARPVTHGVELTVFRGPDAAEADMASTALMVLGAEQALRFMAQRQEWSAARRALIVTEGRRGRVVIALGGRADR